jgi:cbb3-type cytochrome oxidase subunit 3
MMEEQNQEKATATQHVKAADAAAPETGNGKKEDKGGGKKEKKTANPLTPKQLQQRKKLMVYPLMGLLFLGSMWLIFAPSEKREVNRDTVGAFNADIPLPENDGIIGDKRKAYEQAQAERRQAEKVRSLEDFAFSEESDADGVEMELPDSEPEREPFRGKKPEVHYVDFGKWYVRLIAGLVVFLVIFLVMTVFFGIMGLAGWILSYIWPVLLVMLAVWMFRGPRR